MRKAKFSLISILLLLLMGGVVLAVGSDYDIGRWVTSGGGGEQGSENYTVVGVIGQGGAGRSESGKFTLEAGFLTPILPPALICDCGDICVNETGWWRNGSAFNPSSTPIQSAVNNATGGDIICVKDGNYNENVDVGTAYLTIQSENGTANCVVSAANSNDHVFYVTANWTNITRFTVKDATEDNKAGIYLGSVEHCNITNNTAINSTRGICLWESSNNTLTNNTASNNGDGIFLWPLCNNNTLTDNTVSSNTAGITLGSSSNNTLTNNTASSDVIFGIFLDSSSNNTLTNNNASNTQRGIYLWESSNNTLTNNTACNNTYGIYLDSPSSNLIYNNYFDNKNNAWDDGTNIWNITKTAGTNIIGGPYLGGNYWSDYAGTDTDGDGLGNTLLPYDSSGNIQTGGDWRPLVPTVGSTLDGQLSFPGTAAGRVMTVNFYNPGTHAEELWSPKSAITDATGNFTITTGLVAGTYDISVKNHTCLSEVELGIVLVDGATTYVDFGPSREGDSNDDNGVSIVDISILIAAYGTTPGDGDWNANCDYNRDSGVSIADISIMIANYGDSGDPYP